MKSRWIPIVLAVALLLWALGEGPAAAREDFPTAPKKKENGEKWLIGYYEGGPWPSIQQNFISTVQALMAMGWMEETKLPEQQGGSTKELWDWLATSAKSEYLRFVPDAHYSAQWDQSVREKMARQIIERLDNRKDIDLMLAMGTWAGQDLANNKHSTPVVVMVAANAVEAGIVKSAEYSGYDHVHVRVDPTRYERQARIFHEIIGFQKLGIVYENTPTGRSYAALDQVERAAQESGFQIVPCFQESDVPDLKIAEEGVRLCFQELADKVDAIYVTFHGGVSPRNIPALVEIAISERIPTFSQEGSSEVKYGFLLSISHASYKYVARFYAEVIAKILNGAKPGKIGQVFEDPPKIALNLKTAQLIGYDPPVDVLAAADEIYQDIETPAEAR